MPPRAAPPANTRFDNVDLPSLPRQPRVVLIGGTGRVGSSTASNLKRLVPDAELILGSRTAETFDAAMERRPELEGSKHARLDIDDLPTIERAIDGADLVVHTAGPFQRKGRHAKNHRLELHDPEGLIAAICRQN